MKKIETHSPTALAHRTSPNRTNIKHHVNFIFNGEPNQNALHEKQLIRKLSKTFKSQIFQRGEKEDIENQEVIDSKTQPEWKKLKASYQSQISSLRIHNKKQAIDYQNKIKILEKERNEWKDIALRHKIQSQQKDEKICKSQLSNYPSTNNTKVVEELEKQKKISCLALSQFGKIRDENRLLKQEIFKLKGKLPSQNIFLLTHNSGSSSSPRKSSRAQAESHQKIVEVHRNPSRSTSRERSHQKNTTQTNKHSHSHQGNRQIQRLQKVCFQMENIIAERNQDLMKQKAKQLNNKYAKYI